MKVQYRAVALSMPILRARETPPLDVLISLKRLSLPTYFWTIEVVSSVDPSLTMMASKFYRDWLCNEAMRRIIVPEALYAGMITEIREGVNICILNG